LIEIGKLACSFLISYYFESPASGRVAIHDHSQDLVCVFSPNSAILAIAHKERVSFWDISRFMKPKESKIPGRLPTD